MKNHSCWSFLLVFFFGLVPNVGWFYFCGSQAPFCANSGTRLPVEGRISIRGAERQPGFQPYC